MNVAIVTPWFGKNTIGGAERLALDLAHGLQKRGHLVVVHTTCARSPLESWTRSVHKPGATIVDGFHLVRFPLDKTDSSLFREINRKLLAVPRNRLRANIHSLAEEDHSAFARENINSTTLVEHLRASSTQYDAILFLPYLYGTTLNGWRVVRERAVIIPCLHDEAYAYMEPVVEMMRGAARIFFNGPGEFEIAKKLYGPGIISRSRIVGSGITLPLNTQTSDLSRPIGGLRPEQDAYILYLGRQNEEKNVDLLLEAFIRFKAIEPASPLKLVFAGEEHTLEQRLQRPDIIDCGYVREQEKLRLLRNCRALAQPSINESYSRVIMEAWACGRPVLVHRECIVTALALSTTEAGWKAGDAIEWQHAIHTIANATKAQLTSIGAKARSYVDTMASWDRVLDRYEEHLMRLGEPEISVRTPIPELAHILSHANYGESLTNFAVRASHVLQRSGSNSYVVAPVSDARYGAAIRSLETVSISSDATSLFYADSAHSLHEILQQREIRGAAIVVTAPQETGEIITLARQRGIEQIAIIAGSTARSLENLRLGYTVLAPFMLPNEWNLEPDTKLIAGLSDGQRNILAIAPIAPLSRQLEIVEIFAYYLTLDFDARLALVGPVHDDDYLQQLRHLIEKFGLEHRILLPGVVSQPALAAFYRTAHLFVGHRHRYPTGASLLEAMTFDLPVCVTTNEDSRSLLNDSGILVRDVQTPMMVAGLWHVLMWDPEIRARLVAGQRKRLEHFSVETTLDALRRIAERTTHALR